MLTDKIKEAASIQAGKWAEKAAFMAAFGVTGVAVWLAVKTFNKSKEKIDLTLNEMDWDGK